MLLLFLKASRYIFLYFFLFNNEHRSDFRNSPSALGIFRALLMGGWPRHVRHSILPFVQHVNNRLAHPSSPTPSTLPQIRGREQPKSEVMRQSSSIEQPALDVCAEIIGISKGGDLGCSLGANFCWWTEGRWWVCLTWAPHWIIHANRTTTKCLTLHANGPFGRAKNDLSIDLSTSAFRMTTHTMLGPYDNDPPSPPSTNDGDRPPLLPQRPRVPTTHGWRWAPTQTAGGPLSPQRKGALDVRRAGGRQCEICYHHKARRAPITSINNPGELSYCLAPIPIITHNLGELGYCLPPIPKITHTTQVS